MKTHREPDIDTALGWWSELTNKWTPIGWRNHTFRFNVLFNGTVLAEPCLSPRAERWKGLGVQVSCADENHRLDDGSFTQGWNDCTTPLLWTRWQHEGLTVQQQVFAHSPDAPSGASGADSLYAWIRLEIVDTCAPIPIDDHFVLHVSIEAPHLSVGMAARNNIRYKDDSATYPRPLRAESFFQGLSLLEPNGTIRIAVLPAPGCEAAWESDKSRLAIAIPGRTGARVDLLLPMLPTRREFFDKECALGFDEALDEADAFWSRIPTTAAVVDCAEDHINQAITRNLQMAQVLTERNPDSGEVALLTGSLNYQAIWATPIAMTIVLFLDALGYHEEAAANLRLFINAQGSVKPPSDHVSQHPGYLGSPRAYKSIDWLTDHGAVLWAICRHLALSGEPADPCIDTIIKACDFIRDARAVRGHGGVEGVMPPAVNTDLKVPTQSIWSDGWSYKGLAAAARFLEQLEHPSAHAFLLEAAYYKAAFVKAFRAAANEMPVWTALDGTTHPIVPTALSGGSPRDLRTFYLDTGPLFLVFSGLMSARDPLMRSALKFFREGPQTDWYKRDAGPWQMPCLDREMSSCEPGYSWNVYHSHQLHDRTRFLEGMYSLFTGGLSQQTYTVCETRGGITGICPCLPCVWQARLAVVDDQIEPGALHLLRMIPLAWIRTDRRSRFHNVPTEFGPVSLDVGLSADREEMVVDFDTGFRIEPEKIVLHVPPIKGLRGVVVNGEGLDWNGKSGSRARLTLRLPLP